MKNIIKSDLIIDVLTFKCLDWRDITKTKELTSYSKITFNVVEYVAARLLYANATTRC